MENKQINEEINAEVLKAISVLKSGKVSKKKAEKEGSPNLLSIVKKISRNRGKGQ